MDDNGNMADRANNESSMSNKSPGKKVIKMTADGTMLW